MVDSGRLRTILPSPNNPNLVYVLSSGGGLWKTENFLSALPDWEPLTDKIGTTSGGSAALGRGRGTIYLGTGDPFDAPGGFMVTSRDGGESWEDPVYLNAFRVLEVKVDTSQRRDVVLAGTDNGLFRSTDGGETYSLVPALGNAQVWSLVQTSKGWLASAQTNSSPGSASVPSAGTTTLYLSKDHGATWTPTGNGFSSLAGRTTLGVGAGGDAVVYAFASTQADANFNFDQLDLFRSNDGGLNFTALNINNVTVPNPSLFQSNMDVMNGQAWYNQMLLVDPTDPARNTVFVGGNLESAKTTDGGITWRYNSDWLATSGLPYIHADFHCAAITTFQGKPMLLVGSDGGLFVSGDGGATWDSTKNQGLVDYLLYSVTASADHPSNTLIGLQDDGTRLRVDSLFYNQVIGGDGFGTAWSQANDGVTMGTVEFDQIFASFNNPPTDQNNFNTSFFIGNGGFFDFGTYFFTPLATPTSKEDPSGKVFYTFTPTFAWATPDGGNSWSEIGNIDEGPFTQGTGFLNNINTNAPPFGVLFRDTTHGLGVSPNSLGRIGVAMTGGRVAITTNGGATWKISQLNTEVPGFSSFTTNVAWANDKTVYVASVQPAPGAIRVVKSDKAGESGTWVSAQNGLPDVPVYRLLADPKDPAGNTVYAATELGVYYTRDAGSHWKQLGTRLPQVRTSDLYMPPDGSYLRVATYGRGVWQLREVGDDTIDFEDGHSQSADDR